MKKAFPLKCMEKVDGLFHDRLSFKCTLRRGPRQSSRFNVQERKIERPNQKSGPDREKED